MLLPSLMESNNLYSHERGYLEASRICIFTQSPFFYSHLESPLLHTHARQKQGRLGQSARTSGFRAELAVTLRSAC